jgi:radical SAM protein with 4Fe4S-binding SPASM domain
MKEKKKIIKKLALSKIKGSYYKLNYAITSKCNSRCRTCNVWKDYLKNPKIADNDLSLEEITRIFSKLPGDIFWLSLSGGEPFLRDDLAQICQAAVEKIPSLSLISIPSNGLLENIILEKTKKILQSPLPNLFLNFSLDGPEKIHDQIRGISGAFRKTWSTYGKVLQLTRRDPRLAVNLETTISQYNINYLEDFFRKLVKNGHKITVTIAHSGYLYKNIKDDKKFTKLNNGKRIERIIEIVKTSLSPFSPVDLIERAYLSRIPEYYLNRKKKPLSCTALRSSFALDPKGQITPCFMWDYSLGNIKDFDYNFKKFFEKKRKEILKAKKLIENGFCPNCWTPCEAYQSIIQGMMDLKVFI